MHTDNGESFIPKLFGKNVQKYRKKAGLTQEQLSIKLQISQKHMSIIETGTQFASAPLIGKIAEVLEVSPAMLFGGYEHEVNYEQANATALLLEQFIQSQMRVLYSRLDKIEAKLNLLTPDSEIN
ncbi:MAG: helix-turn-helix transcriptional regulator [Spirochaetaceae bacterium]|nr:helix-turn-helix transcriptional regulator [Spirochaetaceae bacterium]